MLLNASRESDEDTAGAAVVALGVETPGPADAATRAQALLAPVLPRRRGPAEADLSAVAAPDGTSVFFCRTIPAIGPDGLPTPKATSWRSDFASPAGARGGTGTAGGTPAEGGSTGEAISGHDHPELGAGAITAIDHVALTQPFDRFDEAALFYRAVLGLRAQHSSQVAAPFGLVRNRAVANQDGTVRICLSVSVLRRGNEWRPGVTNPQHVAFATDDALAAARAARAAEAPILRASDNYYDDLDARLAPPSEMLSAMREFGVLYDRSPYGEFLHFYTDVLGGRVFFEIVQRIGGYEGHGDSNSPVRMTAHRRQRTVPQDHSR